MKQFAALGLAVVVVLWVRAIGGPVASGTAGAALAIGFTLLGAWVFGDVLRRFRLPRLSGYILFGVLIGPNVGDVITETMAVQLHFVTGIATTLIALIAGLTLNLERLGHQFKAIARLTAITLAVSMAGIGAVVWIAWPWLSIAPSASGLERLAIVLLLVVITVSFSPTMTAAVTTETGARGRLSETVLTVVVLADLVLLVLFSLAMLFARVAVGATTSDGVGLLVRFTWEIGGAVAFGVLVGALFALYLRYIGREIALVVIAVCALLSQVGSTQQFEPLLAAVAAGLVIENLSLAQGDALKTAVQGAALPVLVIFFVAVGTSLRLDVLVESGIIVIALSALRLFFIRLGVSLGVRSSGIDQTDWPSTSGLGSSLRLASRSALQRSWHRSSPTGDRASRRCLSRSSRSTNCSDRCSSATGCRAAVTSTRHRDGHSSSSPIASRIFIGRTSAAASWPRRPPVVWPWRWMR